MNEITLVVLAIAGALFMFRTLRGPSLSARVIGMDGMIVAGLALIAVDAVRQDDGIFVPVVVVISLVGFVSTAAAARFIERRDLDNNDHITLEVEPNGDGIELTPDATPVLTPEPPAATSEEEHP